MESLIILFGPELLYPDQILRPVRPGLPIGPHEVYCDYHAGGESVNVELVVSHFIEEHCADCAFHQEVHPDNLGRGIVEKTRERRNRLNPAIQAKERLQELVQVTDPALALEQDVTSDRELLGILVLFESDVHKRQAADKALMVAQELNVSLFSLDAVRVVTTYFADPDIGQIAIQIVRALCRRKPSLFEAVIVPAKYAFEDGHHRETMAYLLGDYVEVTTNASEIAELVPELMAHHTQRMGIGSHRPSEGAIYALRAIAHNDLQPISQAVAAQLADGTKYARLEAVDTLDFLVDDHPELAQVFFEPLLNSLYREEDMYDRSADGITLEVLARIVAQAIQARLPVVEEFYEVAPPGVKALVFGLYEKLVAQTNDEAIQDSYVSKAIHTLAAGIDHIETLEGCAEFLGRYSWKHPEALLTKLDSLIGTLGLLVDRPIEVRQRKTNNPLEWMNQQGLVAQWDGIVSRIQKVIERVGKSNPEIAAPVIQKTITSVDTQSGRWFKGRLIRITGELSRESLAVMQTSLPMLFGFLVDESPVIRGSAVKAFGEMVKYNRDVLPRDVLDLLKEMLLHETNVYVLQNLFQTFQYLHIPDLKFATQACNALVAWEHSFDLPSDKERIMDTLLRIASEFDSLRRAVKPLLWQYCHHEDYWIRSKKLEDWYRWSQQYPEYTLSEFVGLALQFYRDFKAQTSDLNGLDRPFEDLLRLPRHCLAEHLTAIVELAKHQGDARIWNKRDFARLLTIKEYYSHSTQLYFDLAESLPHEPRFDASRCYFRLLGYRDLAEAAVLDGDLAKALEWLENVNALVNGKTDDLEQAQVILRRDLLHLLTNFDLTDLDTFSAKIEAIQQQYAELFDRNYLTIHEIDDPLFQSLQDLLRALYFVCRWARASLNAEADGCRYIEAARNRLAMAIELARKSDSALYAAHTEELSLMLDTVNRAHEIVSFIEAIAGVPFPLIFDYRARDNFRGAKFRQRLLQDSGLDTDEGMAQKKEPEDVHVAEVRIAVDDQVPEEEITLYSGLAHGLRIELGFARWPDRYVRLDIRFLSTSQAVSKFPLLSVDRPEDFSGHIMIDSHLVFEHPLSPVSPPIQAKLVTSLMTTEGDERVLDLFGDRHLVLRVIEKQQAASTQVFISESQGIIIGDQAQVTQHFGDGSENTESS